MAREDAADAPRRAVRQRDSIALLVRPARVGPSINTGSLFKLGLERLRGQRAVVVGGPRATGRTFVLRPRAIRLFLLTGQRRCADPLMLLRGGRVRLRLDHIFPRLLSRRGRRCNKDEPTRSCAASFNIGHQTPELEDKTVQ